MFVIKDLHKQVTYENIKGSIPEIKRREIEVNFQESLNAKNVI